MPVASERTPHAPANYRAEFPLLERCTYLNTCSLGALGNRSRQRVVEFLDVWSGRGASAWYDVWWDALSALRAAYARIIGADSSEIALVPSISAGLSTVAEALDYRSRPRVVTTELDFPTLAYQWAAKAREDVELVIVASPDGVTVPIEAIARATDERTALVATSHVYFTTGAIQDISAVASVAHSRGALCLIDAYQSAGQIPVDAHAAEVDFLAAGGLKWLLGGPGICFLYARRETTALLNSRVTGWFAHRDQFAFDVHHFEPHGDARRFETGTPALAAVHAQLGGLDVITEIGVEAIRDVTSRLTEDLILRAQALGMTPRVAATRAERSAIVAIPNADPARAVADLATQGIVVDARPGHVRISPYFYNTVDDHAAALERLAARA